MKRLILLILSPIILSAQSKAQGVVIDSSKDFAAINLRAMAAAMSNDKCTKVADIRITDNGGYTSTMVFHYHLSASDSVMAMDTVIAPARILIPDTLSAIDIAVVLNIVIAPVEFAAPDIVAVQGIVIAADTIAAVSPIVISNIIVAPVEFVAPGIVAIPGIVIAADTIATQIAEEASVPAISDTAAANNSDIKTPVEDMHLSPNGYGLLQKLEGYAPALYTLHDGGFTIGFGFFVPFNESYKWSKGVTWQEATKMIQQKVPAYEAQVKEYINVPLTQNEFDALTMLAYNLGGFSKATSIINDINEQVELAQLQSDWKKFVHSKAPNVRNGLMKRRNDEIDVRKSANYQPDRKILIFKNRK